jgi:hypothetical protein
VDVGIVAATDGVPPTPPVVPRTRVALTRLLDVTAAADFF